MLSKFYAYDIVNSEGRVIGCEVVQVRVWVNPVELISEIKEQTKYPHEGISKLRRIK